MDNDFKTPHLSKQERVQFETHYQKYGRPKNNFYLDISQFEYWFNKCGRSMGFEDMGKAVECWYNDYSTGFTNLEKEQFKDWINNYGCSMGFPDSDSKTSKFKDWHIKFGRFMAFNNLERSAFGVWYNSGSSDKKKKQLGFWFISENFSGTENIQFKNWYHTYGPKPLPDLSETENVFWWKTFSPIIFSVCKKKFEEFVDDKLKIGGQIKDELMEYIENGLIDRTGCEVIKRLRNIKKEYENAYHWGYILAIVENECKNRLKKIIQQGVIIDAINTASKTQNTDDILTNNSIDDADKKLQYQSLIDKTRNKKRKAVLYLYYIEDKTPKEIVESGTVGLGKSRVYKIINDAEKLLQKQGRV